MLSQPSASSVPPFSSTANNWQLLPDKQAPTLPPRTPTLNPSFLLNGPYSTRYFILFVGIGALNNTKILFCWGCDSKLPFQSCWALEAWTINIQKIWEHRVQPYIGIYNIHVHNLIQSLTSVIFHTLLNPSKKKKKKKLCLGLLRPKVSVRWTHILHSTLILNSCWQPLNSFYCLAQELVFLKGFPPPHFKTVSILKAWLNNPPGVRKAFSVQAALCQKNLHFVIRLARKGWIALIKTFPPLHIVYSA